jgi:uncharacterized membrane protein YciS (DUF1049 family)
MPWVNDRYLIDGWSVYLLFAAGLLIGLCLAVWAGLYFQVQVKRCDRTQRKVQRAEAKLHVAKAHVDRVMAEAAEAIAKTASSSHDRSGREQ